MVAWVGDHEDSPLVAGVVVAQLTRLSQMALATPELETVTVRKRKKQSDGTVKIVDAEEVHVRLIEPSSKIDAVKEYISDNEGKQILVYSSSKQACYLLHKSLQRAGISSEVLSGDTPDTHRKDMVQRFVANKFQVFIAVIQAAAEGVDGLQYATDTAIYLDRSWSTIKNKQSEDRLHRGGTKDTVHIIDVMARSTLDFGRHTRLEEKWSWIKAVLGDKDIQMKILNEESEKE
jgi:SNF2 family DNA or RNA helicase